MASGSTSAQQADLDAAVDRMVGPSGAGAAAPASVGGDLPEGSISAAEDIDAELAAVAQELEHDLVKGATADAAARAADARDPRAAEAERALEEVAADLTALQEQARADSARALDEVAARVTGGDEATDDARDAGPPIEGDYETIDDLDEALAASATEVSAPADAAAAAAPAPPDLATDPAAAVDAALAQTRPGAEPTEVARGADLGSVAAIESEDREEAAAEVAAAEGADSDRPGAEHDVEGSFDSIVAEASPEPPAAPEAAIQEASSARAPAIAPTSPAPGGTPLPAPEVASTTAAAAPASPAAAPRPETKVSPSGPVQGGGARQPEREKDAAEGEPRRGAGGGLLRPVVKALTLINGPIASLPKAKRDIVSIAALVTLFNASALWVFLLMRSPGAPDAPGGDAANGHAPGSVPASDHAAPKAKAAKAEQSGHGGAGAESKHAEAKPAAKHGAAPAKSKH